MKLAIALPPALLLASAATAAPRGETYRAIGTEPGWTLTIERGTIRYVGDYGKTRVITKAPVARPSFNGRRYVTRRITIDITRAACSDGMSDRDYPERVTVTIGRRTVRGCGGAPTATALQLDGSRWTIARLDGRPVTTSRPTEIRFDDGRVAGNAGCNSFGGSYRIERGRFSAGPLISTKMACVTLGGRPGIENTVFAILGGPATLVVDGNTLTLASPAGRIELRRTN